MATILHAQKYTLHRDKCVNVLEINTSVTLNHFKEFSLIHTARDGIIPPHEMNPLVVHVSYML